MHQYLCMHVCMSLCKIPKSRMRQGHIMLSEGQEATETVAPLHPLCLCREKRTRHIQKMFVSTSQTVALWTPGYTQTSSKPRHPALTFLTAENPGDMPADELLEMLKTAKLGSVTGNLQELVLADISDSSLSTREGLRFNQHPSFLASSDPGDLHPLRVGGSENP